MPIYEYECQKCGEIFEVMQKMSDPPPKKHECGSTRVRRVMSRSTFILKGSGWYVTDYARKENGGKDRSKDYNKTESSTKDTKKDSTDKNSSKKSSGKSSDNKNAA